MKPRKYRADNLMPALRLFVAARNAAVAGGITDNGGAIHSVERILDILGLYVRYPHLTHINSLKTDAQAEISAAAHAARQRGVAIKIEHVAPQRAFALVIIGMVADGSTDAAILNTIKSTYRLVRLTAAETTMVNARNRSRIAPDRLAGVAMRAAPR